MTCELCERESVNPVLGKEEEKDLKGEQPYPESDKNNKRPLGAHVIQPTPCNHEFILTQRIPEVGYYSQSADTKKEWVDLEFVCHKCGEIKCYTKKVSFN